MAAITKVTAVVLLVCLIACIEAQGPRQGGPQNNQRGQGGAQNGQRGQGGQGGQRGPGGNQQFGGPGGNQGRRQRSIDHQDGDNTDAFLEPAAQSDFERPSRIRFMPGYLH